MKTKQRQLWLLKNSQTSIQNIRLDISLYLIENDMIPVNIFLVGFFLCKEKESVLMDKFWDISET